MSNKNSNPMWGGHYENSPSEIMEQINASIDFDKKLYSQDIKGSIAHCKMLVNCGILTENEGDTIIEGLKNIKEEIISGKFEFKASLEDIHMNIESRLKEIIGDVAGKLHTARSRNDQVATDFKLYVKESTVYLERLTKELVVALLNKAENYYDKIMPGYTHLQTAQPVTIGHHLMAYVEMFSRDMSRLKDSRVRMGECPLGAAALAGTSFAIDRSFTANELGFNSPTRNSIDSVSDRDFAMEFLSVISIISIHLSRFAEEIVIWSSADFSFVKLSESFTTGSSIMPQKRNPDAAELVRSKAGRIIGSLNSLLIVMKGLPLTYSKDMQEDKEPVFDALNAIKLSLIAMEGMVKDMEFNTEKTLEAASRGYSTATDIADWLVKNLNMPFRNAHHVTGAIVKIAENKSLRLDQLDIEDMKSVEPKITKDIFNVLSVNSSVSSRTSFGGTSPENVLKAIIDRKKDYEI